MGLATPKKNTQLTWKGVVTPLEDGHPHVFLLSIGYRWWTDHSPTHTKNAWTTNLHCDISLAQPQPEVDSLMSVMKEASPKNS